MKKLNRNQIKYLVILAMFIDHIAWGFVPMESVLGQIMHFIGRLTGPTMAFFVVEGYQHTRDVKRYAKRLGLFTLVSWIPYVMFDYGSLPIRIVRGELNANVPAIPIHFASSDFTILFYPWFSVIFSLFLCLLAIWFWDKSKWPKWCKVLGVTGICILSVFGDWPFLDVLYALFLFCYRDQPKKKWIAFYAISALNPLTILMGGVSRNLYQFGAFLPVILLQFFYNGESGSKKPIHKWFFYIFYPAHLLILALIEFGFARYFG